MAAATPRAVPVQRSPPLSLRSQGGTVTPIPDLDVVDLGRRGLLAPDITSPRVSRRQATLLRDEGGNLRVVAQGVNPTAVLTARGELVRLAGGSGSDVEVGDTIVLCPGRMLRDGGARVLDGDEAYTIVEAEIDNLPAALREIKRLRTELAARPPAPPWLGRRTPADEGEAAADGEDGDAAAADTEGEAAAADADDADADDKTEDARGGASDDDDADDRGTKRRAGDDAEPPAEAKRRRGNCVIC
mmetsp:Transcript_16324/g.42999  ORF Transcript_16324/g.42999 Transcript_16324/m.42999 type:complete len:245 (-) Transcript_16324:38-772(-)